MEQRLDNGAIHIIERRCRLNVDAPYLLKKVHAVHLFVQMILVIHSIGTYLEVETASTYPGRSSFN